MDEEAEALAELVRLRSEVEEVEAIVAQCAARRREAPEKRDSELKRRESEEAAEAEQRRLQEQEEQARRAKEAKLAAQKARGVECDFFLSDGEHVQSCFDPDVTCVATNGTATILLYTDGSWAYTYDLPTRLYNKLNGRSRTLPAPTYVALGSSNRYYIQFADGKRDWLGCKDMGEELQDGDAVSSVAFGGHWESYFVVFASGGWACRNVPAGLKAAIESLGEETVPKTETLGSAGQWYLEARDSRAWWDGINKKTIGRIAKHKDSVMFIDFGGYDKDHAQHEFFMRYS
jgi:predicted DCC family thiol-disulfide oxidoreductase YuxK